MKYFMKCFDDLEKHHKMINILKHIFDVQKPFYKSNYTTQYSTFVVPPSEDQV